MSTCDMELQSWEGMDGATAFQLIERKAKNWEDISRMMEEWRAANSDRKVAAPHEAGAESTEITDWVVECLGAPPVYFRGNRPGGFEDFRTAKVIGLKRVVSTHLSATDMG